MTWSIIAKDSSTGRVGIIVVSKAFAIGSRVPYIKTGVGAIASQSRVNPFFGSQGLMLMQAGATAEQTVNMLTTADEGRDWRQVHAMDRSGAFAAYTGGQCRDWAGQEQRDGISVAGNSLAGADVIGRTLDAYEKASSMPFARRLIAAMTAGEAAGGDARGKQAASLLIHGEEDYPLLDLRVDDHEDPLAELARLETVSRELWVHQRRLAPSKAQPYGKLDDAEREALLAASRAERYE